MDQQDQSQPVEREQAEQDRLFQRELEAALQGASPDQLMEESVAAAARIEKDQPAGAPGGKGEAKPESEPPFDLELRRGRITRVSDDDVFVELAGIPGKNQGVVPLTQFERPPRPGSIMDFVIQRFDEAEGLYILSREGAVGRATWDHLYKGAVVEARVTATNKGGLDLEMVGGIKAFMPASHVDLHHVADLEGYVGQKLHASVQEIERKAKRVILSRKLHLLAQREAAAKKLWKEMEVGQNRQGKVSRIVEYGAFVDLGGVDGLIHISDLSYSHVGNVADVVSVGQDVTVKLLKLDAESGKIRLGLKQASPDPWEGIEGRVKVGDKVQAKVLRLADFGAFVEVLPGVEGLLPISEMSWTRIAHPCDVVKEGDVLHLAVILVDPEKRRLTVSLKQSQGDPWIGAQHKYAPHSVVDATVLRTTDFGAFVELERGVEGLAHISELAPRRVANVEEVVKVGERRTFRVLEVDEENRRIKLSIKALEASPPAPPEVAKQARQAPPGSRPQPAKAAARKHDKNLKGGMGASAALGMGLGDLKL